MILDRVRDTQARYERLTRRLAPTVFEGGRPNRRCDERIGRFCLYHDPTDRRPREEEPERAARAREDMIETVRGAFARLPGEFSVAGALVRYLVEDDRVSEAVSAARTFAAVSPDTTAGLLLRGFAHHAAGRHRLAERDFDQALDRMPEEERRAVERVDLLLSYDERRHYRSLTDDEQRDYERAFWTLANPLYIIPGNDRRAAHIARHVWSRLLAETPVTRGMNRWGDDLEELTLRYGVATHRARIVGSPSLQPSFEWRMVEWYDSAQLAFAPGALHTEGIPPAPPPGTEWRLDDPSARTKYAAVGLRRIDRISHRVGRFPDGDSVRLRIDGVLALDSTEEARTVETGLFVLDENHTMVRRRRASATVREDTVDLSFEVTLPPGRYVYSLEVLDTVGGVGGRARYRVDLPRYPRTVLALSDVLGRRAFGTDRPSRARGRPDRLPRPAWHLLSRDTLGLYAEAHHLIADADGRTRYQVEVTVRPVRSDALPARAARWLGRKLGIIDATTDTRWSWESEGDRGSPGVVAVDLALDGLGPGTYTLRLSITDRVSGVQQTSERVIRVGGEESGR